MPFQLQPACDVEIAGRKGRSFLRWGHLKGSLCINFWKHSEKDEKLFFPCWHKVSFLHVSSREQINTLWFKRVDVNTKPYDTAFSWFWHLFQVYVMYLLFLNLTNNFSEFTKLCNWQCKPNLIIALLFVCFMIYSEYIKKKNAEVLFAAIVL